MSYFFQKELPMQSFDGLVIVGAGTAGVAAALSAADLGQRCLLIEESGQVGGSQTSGLVSPMMPNFRPGHPYSSAIDLELCHAAREEGLCASWEGNIGYFDPLALVPLLERKLEERGVGIRYFSTLVSVVREDRTIKGLIIKDREGLSLLQAEGYIDCSGDAVVVKEAGCSYSSGNGRTGSQPMSLRFIMDGVDLRAFGSYLRELGQRETVDYPVLHTASVRGAGGWVLNPVFEKAWKDGLLEESDLSYFQCFSVPGKPKQIAFNCPELEGGEDILSSAFLSRQMIAGRKAIWRISAFFRDRIPGFAGAQVCQVASLPGIRESRRALCEYTLTGEDIARCRSFSDGIAYSAYPVDIHGDDEDASLAETGEDQGSRVFSIPYRSLVVAELDKLLVAGRCGGFDYLAQSAVRIQHSCRAMGEAAGIGAAMALKQGRAFRQIEGSAVRRLMDKRLEAMNQLL